MSVSELMVPLLPFLGNIARLGLHWLDVYPKDRCLEDPESATLMARKQSCQLGFSNTRMLLRAFQKSNFKREGWTLLKEPRCQKGGFGAGKIAQPVKAFAAKLMT